MTNILAQIVVMLVTNTASIPNNDIEKTFQWNGSGVMVQEGDMMMPGRFVPSKNPTSRTNSITVTEVTTLKFDWCGPREERIKRTISQTNWVEVLKMEWVPK